MDKTINSIVDCTGCKACEMMCPHVCIHFIQDREGFCVPKIDETKCVKCGLCYRRCPQNNSSDLKYNYDKRRVLAIRTKDETLLKRSASGGAFAGMAQRILCEQGVVFGCSFSKNLMAEHVVIDDVNQLYRIQSSKYVQSDVKKTYLEAKDYLESGKLVLYSGTPCQIAGLKAFLNKKYDNLITVDLLCHGVPSPKLFEAYLSWLAVRHGKVIHYNFRSKKKESWGLEYRSHIMTKSGEVDVPVSFDPYCNAFIEGKTLRNCCYNCHYGTEARVGDITLGDFWGLKGAIAEAFDGKGISFMQLNNAKAEASFKTCSEDFFLYYETEHPGASDDWHLKKSLVRPNSRDVIYDGYDALGYFDGKLKSVPSVKRRIVNLFPARVILCIKKHIAF